MATETAQADASSINVDVVLPIVLPKNQRQKKGRAPTYVSKVTRSNYVSKVTRSNRISGLAG
jgi:hypothetical protein